ncbi:hypothetical protein, partial [Streptomyces sp. NRRL S-146]|uniref:hypothetical protein n=1 Tax=Streptomyces sp. NRRL S-146 TaxID=1463884 RepID=UPI00131CE1BF
MSEAEAEKAEGGESGEDERERVAAPDSAPAAARATLGQRFSRLRAWRPRDAAPEGRPTRLGAWRARHPRT